MQIDTDREKNSSQNDRRFTSKSSVTAASWPGGHMSRSKLAHHRPRHKTSKLAPEVEVVTNKSARGEDKKESGERAD